jgi:hypothetical protein
MNAVVKLIAKYALLLTGLYIIERSIGLSVRYANPFRATGLTITEKELRILFPSLMSLVLNAIVVLVILKDKKKVGVTTQYVVISTLVYRPFGVCLFLPVGF